MSGAAIWMISATALACALSGVDRSVTSWPAALRFNEALNVAMSTVSTTVIGGWSMGRSITVVVPLLVCVVMPGPQCLEPDPSAAA